METIKNNDFIELQFTGRVDGSVFDSTDSEELKKIDPDAKDKKLVVAVGHGMVIPGLDKALLGKEIDQEYKIDVPYQEAFGPRKTTLVKTIPLSVFTNQKISPSPGMSLLLDNMLVKVLAISGARVIADFNNPLAGKNLHYTFKAKSIVTDEKEKVRAFFEFFFRFVPEFEISDKVTIKGVKELAVVVKIFNDRFKELFNKELVFQQEEKPLQAETAQ